MNQQKMILTLIMICINWTKWNDSDWIKWNDFYWIKVGLILYKKYWNHKQLGLSLNRRRNVLCWSSFCWLYTVGCWVFYYDSMWFNKRFTSSPMWSTLKIIVKPVHIFDSNRVQFSNSIDSLIGKVTIEWWVTGQNWSPECICHHT